MRTAIFLGSFIIATAINPAYPFAIEMGTIFKVAIIAFVIADIAEVLLESR